MYKIKFIFFSKLYALDNAAKAILSGPPERATTKRFFFDFVEFNLKSK